MLHRILWAISTHARACLVVGLIGGLALPSLAAAMVPWLPHMVALLLVTTALRVGHREALGAIGDLRWGLAVIVALQMVVPLILLGLLHLAGLSDTPAALAVVLTSAAPAITGSVNLALIMRLDAGRMMQILVLGTAAFPVTVLPVLWAMPQLGAAGDILGAALSLLAVIALATVVGFTLRARVFPDPSPGQIKALDGLSVLAFCIIVVGLMAALNPALRADPRVVLNWALLAFAIGYGLQLLALMVLRRSPLRPFAGPIALAAGNRNVAIFLVALPADILAPLMIFIGCWQLPMYLTPVLMPKLYARALRHD
ncbi:hypothetical protein [Sulfitobacter sp. JB4-11]|uniref:hypothetical protein n=1 Tax=Sulfitobacter rhodophyticola TaxID=3238304 RepID=UPI003515324A